MSQERTRSAAERYRTWRSRQGRNAICAHIELGPDFVTALKRRGVIGPDETPGRDELSAHAHAVLTVWSAEAKES